MFIIEVMGHKVGHVTLHAGIAGGADIILLPEIPYDIKSIVKVMMDGQKQEKHLLSLQLQRARSPRKMRN